MPDRLDEFVHQENIREFKRKLAVETDPERRKFLEDLLAAELARKLPLLSPPRGSSGTPPGAEAA